MSAERLDAIDYGRRGLWLALGVGLVLALGGGGFSYFVGGKLQIWFFVANRIALAISLVLSLLLVVPDVRARLGPRVRSEPGVFAWAFAFFVLGMLLAVAAGIEGAIDALDEDLPFS